MYVYDIKQIPRICSYSSWNNQVTMLETTFDNYFFQVSLSQAQFFIYNLFYQSLYIFSNCQQKLLMKHQKTIRYN